MDWDDLRILLAVRRHGSHSAAARALGVNQTTVGRRLTSLEEKLGARLFTRTSSGYALTDAGQRACDVARAMESSASALHDELHGRDAAVQGVVRITLPGGLVPQVGPSLARLSAEHPKLSFHLRCDVATLNLLQGEADVAIRMVNPGQPSLLARKVGEWPWAVYASEAYLRRRGLPPTDLAGHDVIGFDDALAGTPGGRWLATHAGKATFVARVNNVLAAAELAAAGLGLSLAPSNIGAHVIGLQPVLRPPGLEGSPTFLVTSRELRNTPRVRVTMERLATDLRAALAAHGPR